MIERAHRSHDPQLVGFALYCKAMLHTDMADGPGVDHPGESGGPQTWKDEGPWRRRGSIRRSCGNAR